MQDSYFKDDDFSGDPIKKYLKPYYFNAKANASMYYYMLVSQNQVILNDNALYGDPNYKSYIETRVEYSTLSEIPDGEGTTNAYVAAYIQMDDTVKVTQRNVYTVPMAFSATGGFMTVTFLITLIIV